MEIEELREAQDCAKLRNPRKPY